MSTWSILSDAISESYSFFSNVFGNSSQSSAPQTPEVISATRVPVGQTTASSGSSYSFLDAAGDAMSIFGPLITTAVSRPKPLPMPEPPKYPDIPDSVKNDPRVQQLLGAYGFPDNFPSVKQQALNVQSDFQLAFPAMYEAGLGILQRQTKQTTAQRQQEDDAKQSSTIVTTVEPSDVAASRSQEIAPVSRITGVSTSDSVQGTHIETTRYDDMLEDTARQYRLPVDLLRAATAQESESSIDRSSLRQMQDVASIDTSGRVLSDKEAEVPQVAIQTMAKYIKQLHEQFGGDNGDPDYEKTISEYNRRYSESTGLGISVPSSRVSTRRRQQRLQGMRRNQWIR